MKKDLQFALRGLITEERLFILMDALDVLDRAGRTSHIEEIQTIFSINDDTGDNTILVSRITDCISIAQEITLAEFGVKLKPSVHMDIATAVIRGVVLVEDYIIPEHIIGLLTGDFSEEEIVAKIASLFDTADSEEVLEWVETVSGQLISRLEEIFVAKFELTQDLDPQPAQRAGYLNRLIATVGEEQAPSTVKLVRAGTRIGAKLKTIYECVIEELEGEEPSVLTNDILGLVLLSDVETSSVMTRVFEDIDEFYTDRPTYVPIAQREVTQLAERIGLVK